MRPAPDRTPRVVTLRVPVKYGDAELSELTIQRPTARELWGLKLPGKAEGASIPMGDLLSIAARCAGVPDAVIQRLDCDDAFEVVGVVGEFLGSSLQTGT